MPIERCNCCLSPEIKKSPFVSRDLIPLLVGVHAFHCDHCFERQYRVVNPITQLIVKGLIGIDNTVNLLHPDVRRERFDRRRSKAAAHNQ